MSLVMKAISNKIRLTGKKPTTLVVPELIWKGLATETRDQLGGPPLHPWLDEIQVLGVDVVARATGGSFQWP